MRATVNDDDTGTETETLTVTVSNVAPNVTFGAAPLAANEGDTKHYTYTFTDPGTDVWTHSVSCGNGGLVSNDDFMPLGAKSGSFDCTWADDMPTGTASDEVLVRATVNDDDTGTETETLTVTVSNVAPNVTFGAAPLAANEGDTKHYTYTFTDPGTDVWTHSVSCGNGGLVSNDDFMPLGAKSGSFDCTWADDMPTGTASDEVLVRATVNDDDTGTETETLTVTVSNVAPNVTFGAAPLAANEGDTNHYTYTFTDPGTDVWTHSVSCGNGGLVSNDDFMPLGAKSGSFDCTWADDMPTGTASDEVLVRRHGQ